jgi:hypothetical protein
VQGEASATKKPTKAKLGKDPRKHHYVPIFYQRAFTNENELLWVYDRVRREYKELHPLVVCFEKDLYAVKPDNKPLDMQVETKILRSVDAFGSRAIREFIERKPTPESEDALALFIAFQWLRVPTQRRDIRATYVNLIDELTRISFANVERAKEVMERYAPDYKEGSSVTPESMVEAIQGKHVKVEATEMPFLTTMMEQAETLSELLPKLEWEILVAPNDTGFIICDCPVVVVPPKGSNDVGFLVPGSVKYLPIERHHCVRLGEPGTLRRYRTIDKEAVRTINQNIAANSERFIMGPSQLQLEHVVTRSESQRIERKPRLIVETVQSDEDGSLQKLVSQPRRYFYPKNGAASAP